MLPTSLNVIWDHVSSVFGVDLLVSNFLGFCLSENVFISPSFSKDIFPGSQFLGWQLSTSFNTWKLSFHCLPMSIVSIEKAVDSFIIALLQVDFFFWLLLRFFFVFGFQQFYYDVTRSGFLWICATWGSHTFWNHVCCFSSVLENVESLYLQGLLLPYSLIPLLLGLITHI